MSVRSLEIGPYTAGEIPAPLVYQYQMSNGGALDISAGYSAVFAWREEFGDPEDATATVSNGAAGEVTYTWDGTELQVPGRYRAEFWVGNGTQRFASVLFRYSVRRSVAVPVPSI